MVLGRVVSNNLRGVYSNVRVLRDQKKREAAAAMEIQRRAYLYVARNTSLPATIRHRAQLGLNSLGGRMTVVRDRCTDTGKGRGMLNKFGLCRYAFRLRALAGDIPGMNKASF